MNDYFLHISQECLDSLAKNKNKSFFDKIIQSSRFDGVHYIILNSKYVEISDNTNIIVEPELNDPEEKLQITDIYNETEESLRYWFESGFDTPSLKCVTERIEVCKQCEYWDTNATENIGRCNILGCTVHSKIRSKPESCPLNKWTSVE